MIAHVARSRRNRMLAFGAVALTGVVAATAAVVLEPGAAASWVLGGGLAALTAGVLAVLKTSFRLLIDNRQLQAELVARTEQTGRMVGQVQDLMPGLDRRLGRAERVLDVLEERIRQAEKRIGPVEKRLAEVQKAGARADQRAARLAEETQRAAGVVRELGAGLRVARSGLATVRGETYQDLARDLNDDERRELAAFGKTLGVPVDMRRVHYLERKLLDVETRCRGRLAASIGDVVTRALIAGALPGRDARILEIGVLHAVSAAYLFAVAADRYESFHQTLLDPFFGYYGGDEPDPYTGVPVSELTARYNLQAVGAPEASFDLLVGLSTNEAIRKQAATADYGLVLIDGDHSYEVVAADFEAYAGLVTPGGYLLFDDYRASNWPDVGRFVDEVAKADPRFEYLESPAKAAVFLRCAGAGPPRA